MVFFISNKLCKGIFFHWTQKMCSNVSSWQSISRWLNFCRDDLRRWSMEIVEIHLGYASRLPRLVGISINSLAFVITKNKIFLFLNLLLAVCTPQCLNGGKCIGKNNCMCPEEFRGPYCQYRKLQINLVKASLDLRAQVKVLWTGVSVMWKGGEFG